MKVWIRPLILVILVACNDATTPDLATEFKETPFRHLRGVELGMTGKQLRAVRPTARYAPYLGMQERIPGFTVSYGFPNAISDSRDATVPDSDKLEGVYITEAFVSLEEAEKKWHEVVRGVAAAHRAPNSCESFPVGGRQARWNAGENVFVIGVFPREPIAANVGDRVLYTAARAVSINQPKGGTTIACPTT